MTRLALALLLVACHPGEACDASHPETAALLAECKLRVVRECPSLKRGECEPNKPCPQCPVLESCDAEVRKACGRR